MNINEIGIVGFGYIGRALYYGLGGVIKSVVYDPYCDFSGIVDIGELVKCQILFVSVPTPMRKNGKQDLSCVKEALDEINDAAMCPKLIVIRSTILPGTTRHLSKMYPKHNFVHWPEFLRERSSRIDFVHPARIIIGGSTHDTVKVEEVLRKRFTATPIFHVSPEEAEITKYMSNCFLAVKVSFANEFSIVCEKMGADYEKVKKMVLADGRIGKTHFDVPGHDGELGYGGTCLPKDTKAFIQWSLDQGVLSELVEAADSVNNKCRTKKDWENE